eukprot:CAMPEP_0202972398 /NCGR_PEP_ID=MMETSP1396-20130829/36230_1 /ASSEMBLY_ACC=CAM_ASM_000872 /TAXON_ID= /ORGANISM="Pseudokeronopsis sp., Strain Brazil" /LENGTH=271 /DNA_ID=CAMNT_0049702767 /DNA_START=198 /DNA_END=1010 /DNA_ORIENTATION=+
MKVSNNLDVNRAVFQPPKKMGVVDVEVVLGLRLELLGRVESLPHVSVAKVPYLTSLGDMINIPGPWSIEVSTAIPGLRADTSNAEIDVCSRLTDDDGRDNDGDDDIETISEYGDNLATTTICRSVRSISSATTVSAVSIGEISSSPMLTSSIGKCVVLNEFGHVRVQPLLELLESFQEHSRRVAVVNSSLEGSDDYRRMEATMRVGGHLVLPQSDFEECISMGLGEKHPFAGRYHPISGNVIPETTLLFYGPRNQEELEAIWLLVRKSYEW